MAHIDSLKCQSFHYYKDHVLVIKHKRMCKDGKYRGYANSKQYCVSSLIIKDDDLEFIPFSSSEMNDLRRVHNFYIKNNIINI